MRIIVASGKMLLSDAQNIKKLVAVSGLELIGDKKIQQKDLDSDDVTLVMGPSGYKYGNYWCRAAFGSDRYPPCHSADPDFLAPLMSLFVRVNSDKSCNKYRTSRHKIKDICHSVK